MATVKLSFSIMLIHWCNKVVDWFMKFFEDSELYWVEDETRVKHVDTYTMCAKQAPKTLKVKYKLKLVIIKIGNFANRAIRNIYSPIKNFNRDKYFLKFSTIKESIYYMFD